MRQKRPSTKRATPSTSTLANTSRWNWACFCAGPAEELMIATIWFPVDSIIARAAERSSARAPGAAARQMPTGAAATRAVIRLRRVCIGVSFGLAIVCGGDSEIGNPVAAGPVKFPDQGLLWSNHDADVVSG